MSLYIAIFMNDLAIEIKNLGLGIRVGDHDPFHTSTRPIASENRCKLYPPERKLTKAILTLLNLEGEAQGEI